MRWRKWFSYKEKQARVVKDRHTCDLQVPLTIYFLPFKRNVICLTKFVTQHWGEKREVLCQVHLETDKKEIIGKIKQLFRQLKEENTIMNIKLNIV